MKQTLPEGATILPGDLKRIIDAQANLASTKGSTAAVTVTVQLHVFREYPKHVMLDGKTVLVNSATEEAQVAIGRHPSYRHRPLPTKAHLESIGKRLPK